jgi:iron complex outermembrane receptor protein
MNSPFSHAAVARAGLIIFLLGILSPPCAYAATWQPDPKTSNDLKQLSLEQLGDVEVTTASKVPAAVWKIAAAIYVITHDDIMRSGATSIPEALRLAPGVEVARIDSSKWSIGIRGFGSRLSRSVLVLIDGRTVYTTLLAGTYWEVQDTVMDDIERIEVIRGPGGTIWGPNAVNGVINIITKSAKNTHGTLVSVGGGNIEQGFFNARQGWGNGTDLNYRVYAKGFNRGPQYHYDDQNFDRWRAAQAGFRADWDRNSENRFTFQGDIYDEGTGESVIATSYTKPYQQNIRDTAHLSGGNILGRWSRTQGDGRDIQVQAYYDRTNRHEPNFGDLRDTFDIDFLQRFRLPARQQISWGLGARFSHGNDLQVVSGLTFQPPQRTDELLTAFLQDEIALVDHRLSLSLGTKLLHTNFTGVHLEPSIRLLWNPDDKQSLWTAFTHAVRTPSDAERDFFLSGFIAVDPSTGTPFFARFNANRHFRAEQLNGYEIGYRRLLGKTVFLDIAGYYNHYGALFSEEITGPPFLENLPAPPHFLLPAQFGNGLVGTTEGGEIAAEWRPREFWRLRGSYSFLEMHIEKVRNSLDVGTAPGIQGSSPQHQVQLQSGFQLAKSFNLDLAYRYVSSLPGQAPNGFPDLYVRSYSTADATFRWRFSKDFGFTVAGQNLLQPQHVEFAGDPGPQVGIKRSAYLEITYEK